MELYTCLLGDIALTDVAKVGGKNASLGEMIRELGAQGIRVPGGFAITADAYRLLLRQGGLAAKLREILAGLDTAEFAGLADRGRRVREAILTTPLPPELEREIAERYRALGDDVSVAVRSSATAEDLPDSSFAGQQESFLNIRGERALLRAVHECYASLFTDRAISYRVDRGFDQFAVALSIGVQRMVRSDLASAGVLFTIDTESGFPDVVLISSSWGLGESVVKGRVDPDEFLVHKPTLRAGFRPIVKRAAGGKQEKLVYSARGGRSTRVVAVPPEERAVFTLTDDEVLQLARWGCDIEDHYSARAGRRMPMDVEWAKDGETGELFILQARPETVHSRESRARVETFRLLERAPVLATGKSVGSRIGAGLARVIRNPEELASFKPGEILIADMTDPDWEPTMKMAAGVVTNRGGRTCHAAIVSRELGVPCVVGTGEATAAIETGRAVTVSCAEGDVGKIYDGSPRFERETLDLTSLVRPRTKILMNVGDPDQAFSLAAIPNDGVGLARLEFILSSSVGIHPLALTRFESLPDSPAKKEIEARTRGWASKPDYFVEKLAEGVGRLAAAFYPKPVVVRLSDFKTNEYSGLLGGEAFEPREENPMIGFRGASRYYDERYREGFLLECRAMRKVREEMGLTNVKLMVPFCRTPEEGRRVLEVMASAGLVRGRLGLEVLVMCEIPANVILTEEFSEIFDGFSIGSNDLTQLILGLDRDSEIVAHLFDERSPAVTRMIADVIRRAHAAGRTVGICGQAPSDYPEFAAFLVEQGIDSMSLSPDRVLETTRAVLEIEKERRPAGEPRVLLVEEAPAP